MAALPVTLPMTLSEGVEVAEALALRKSVLDGSAYVVQRDRAETAHYRAELDAEARKDIDGRVSAIDRVLDRLG